ncbi:MAG: hypothetical protein V4631_19120 [Pseudomonadota bacterium]
MNLQKLAIVAAIVSASASAQQGPEAPIKLMGVVSVEGGRPTSLPTQIPTTIEGITAAQIEQTINATDSEDALKYLPSLTVRKRFIGDYNHKQASVSLGDRSGKLAWWFNLNRLQSTGQPLSFATRMPVDSTTQLAGKPVVTGAIASINNKGQPWWLLGTTTSYRTVQDHAKFKLAYDVTPTLRASYTFGWWKNDTDGGVNSYLRDSAGRPVYAGNVVIDGRQYNLGGSSLA